MSEHLGYEKHDRLEEGTGNIHNGTRTKTVLTDHHRPVVIDGGTAEGLVVTSAQ
jgi:putative transposase